MFQQRVQFDLLEWFIEIGFFAFTISAIIYIPSFKWRETVTGRIGATLFLAIPGALFRSVLTIWGVVGRDAVTGFWNDFFSWLSVVSLGAVAVAGVALVYEIIRYLQTDNSLLGRNAGEPETTTGKRRSSLLQMRHFHRSGRKN